MTKEAPIYKREIKLHYALLRMKNYVQQIEAYDPRNPLTELNFEICSLPPQRKALSVASNQRAEDNFDTWKNLYCVLLNHLTTKPEIAARIKSLRFVSHNKNLDVDISALIATLCRLESLTVLVRDNDVTFDLRAHSALQHLHIFNKAAKKLFFPESCNIKTMLIRGVCPAKLQIVDFKKLEKMYLFAHNVTRITVENCPLLTEMKVESFRLYTVTVSKNCPLIKLDLDSRSLAALNIAAHKTLQELFLRVQRLERLDLSDYAELKQANIAFSTTEYARQIVPPVNNLAMKFNVTFMRLFPAQDRMLRLYWIGALGDYLNIENHLNRSEPIDLTTLDFENGLADRLFNELLTMAARDLGENTVNMALALQNARNNMLNSRVITNIMSFIDMDVIKPSDKILKSQNFQALWHNFCNFENADEINQSNSEILSQWFMRKILQHKEKFKTSDRIDTVLRSNAIYEEFLTSHATQIAAGQNVLDLAAQAFMTLDSKYQVEFTNRIRQQIQANAAAIETIVASVVQQPASPLLFAYPSLDDDDSHFLLDADEFSRVPGPDNKKPRLI